MAKRTWLRYPPQKVTSSTYQCSVGPRFASVDLAKSAIKPGMHVSQVTVHGPCSECGGYHLTYKEPS